MRYEEKIKYGAEKHRHRMYTKQWAIADYNMYNKWNRRRKCVLEQHVNIAAGNIILKKKEKRN